MSLTYQSLAFRQLALWSFKMNKIVELMTVVVNN